MRPNPSLEPTRTGMALGPRGAVVHHPPRGPSATPALQVLLNVKVMEKKDFEQMPKVQHKIGEIERRLGGRGRVLVRYSGTEFLARVMLEGEDEKQIRAMAESIADEIRAEVGK